jgi:branched-chain amino acid transport system permease protein
VFGGLGSLVGCFIASIIMGLVTTICVVIDYSIADLLKPLGMSIGADDLLGEILSVPVSRIGALLPFAMMILILMIRPRGLLGTRDT